MTHITDLFGHVELVHAIDDGLVRVQQHRTLPLEIFNYTEKAQYDKVWTPVTLQCRGLIVDDTGTVVARPFAKFFNYAEHPEDTFKLDARVWAYDKLDGSLGITYPTPDGPAIATRGSFTSEQAIHATQVLRERYPDFEPVPGITYLYEIVYPQNRIVVDYGDTDDLFYLGAVNIPTGQLMLDGDVKRLLGWRGPATNLVAHSTLAEVLALEPRKNAEGVVVWFGNDTLVKVKQDDYVALHRIITGLNARIVWEQTSPKKGPDELLADLPDEFHEWVWDVYGTLLTEHDETFYRATERFLEIADDLLDLSDRKAFAEQAKGSEFTPYLFMMLDGKNVSDRIWYKLKPRADWSPVPSRSEDVA